MERPAAVATRYSYRDNIIFRVVRIVASRRQLLSFVRARKLNRSSMACNDFGLLL